MYRSGVLGYAAAHWYSDARHGLVDQARPSVTPTTPKEPPLGYAEEHCGHEMSCPEVPAVGAPVLAEAVVVPVVAAATATPARAATASDRRRLITVDCPAQTED
jgi:hypothetical protein